MNNEYILRNSINNKIYIQFTTETQAAISPVSFSSEDFETKKTDVLTPEQTYFLKLLINNNQNKVWWDDTGATKPNDTSKIVSYINQKFCDTLNIERNKKNYFIVCLTKRNGGGTGCYSISRIEKSKDDLNAPKETQPSQPDYWKGFPNVLKEMCIAVFIDNDDFLILPSLQYLLVHMYDYDTFHSDKTPYDAIRWIDEVFEHCLFSLETHEDAWSDYSNEISQILKNAEMLMDKIAPSDYKKGYRTAYEDPNKFNIIEYKQKLDVYLCVLDMYTEDWDQFSEHLNCVLDDSKRNIKYLLRDDRELKYITEGDYPYLWFPGSNPWEPIDWLMHEYISSDKAKLIYADVYEQYVRYLVKLNDSLDSVSSRHVLNRAKKRLIDFCIAEVISVEETLDGYVDVEDDSESYNEDEEYLALQSSKKRLDEIIDYCSGIVIEDDLDTKDENHTNYVDDKDYYIFDDDDLPF